MKTKIRKLVVLMMFCCIGLNVSIQAKAANDTASFTITYKNKDNGATISQSYVNVKHGTEITLKPADTFEKVGYTLARWHESSIVREEDDYLPSQRVRVRCVPNEQFVPTEDVWFDARKSNTVLEAAWEPNKYTVSFELNTETAYVVCNNKTVVYDRTYGSLPIPTRVGYHFDGWKHGNTWITNSTKVTTPANHTLVAQWSPLTVKVKLDSQGGTCEKNTASLVYQKDKYGSLPQCTKEGYTFNGWAMYDECAPDNVFGEYELVGIWEDVTLYAIYTPNKYTITFDPNGGYTVCGFDDFEVEYNARIARGLPTTERYGGYIFKGWSTDLKGTKFITEDTIYTYPKDIVVYAIWEKDKTVSENENTNSSQPTMHIGATKKFKVKNIKGNKIKVSFEKTSGCKYQIQYATKKNFKNAKTKNVTKNSATIKKLKNKKNYYVRVRAWSYWNDKKVYGKWSKVVKVKINK